MRIKIKKAQASLWGVTKERIDDIFRVILLEGALRGVKRGIDPVNNTSYLCLNYIPRAQAIEDKRDEKELGRRLKM